MFFVKAEIILDASGKSVAAILRNAPWPGAALALSSKADINQADGTAESVENDVSDFSISQIRREIVTIDSLRGPM